MIFLYDLANVLFSTHIVLFRYLHEVCSPSIIHKNIKSANILLDVELNPHLSDSGLASSIPNADQVLEFFHPFILVHRDVEFYVVLLPETLYIIIVGNYQHLATLGKLRC